MNHNNSIDYKVRLMHFKKKKLFYLLMGKIIFLIAIVVLNSLSADKIFFLNSDILTGEVWKTTLNNVVLVSEHGNYKINSKKIQSIQFDGLQQYRLMFNDGKNILIIPIQSDLVTLEFKPVLENGNVSNSNSSAKWNQILFLRLIKN